MKHTASTQLTANSRKKPAQKRWSKAVSFKQIARDPNRPRRAHKTVHGRSN